MKKVYFQTVDWYVCLARGIEMLLSDRMRAVVRLVQPCKSIADIGCDHGYVAIDLVQGGICNQVIAMDIHKGPLDRANHHIIEYGLQEYIETRLSDGTNALRVGEVEGMICAGMGGKLILSILESGNALVMQMQQIILQPQSEIGEVRKYLRKMGFLIEKEDMVYEDGKYYPMMRVLPRMIQENDIQLKKEQSERFCSVQDTYGPCLLEMAHPVLKKYLLHKRETLKKISKNLLQQKYNTSRQQNRIAQIDKELSDITFCLYNFFDKDQ